MAGDAVPAAQIAPVLALTQEELYRAAIGPSHTAFYLHDFAQRDASGGSRLSWNWPAFFACGLWGLHRKTWAFAFAFVVIGFTLTQIWNSSTAVWQMMSGWSELGRMAASILFGTAVNSVFALLANGYYHRKVKRMIAATKETVDPQQRLAALRLRGGTLRAWLWLLVVPFGIGLLGFALMVAFFSLPDQTPDEPAHQSAPAPRRAPPAAI